jgi:hypothetical protein
MRRPKQGRYTVPIQGVHKGVLITVKLGFGGLAHVRSLLCNQEPWFYLTPAGSVNFSTGEKKRHYKVAFSQCYFLNELRRNNIVGAWAFLALANFKFYGLTVVQSGVTAAIADFRMVYE